MAKVLWVAFYAAFLLLSGCATSSRDRSSIGPEAQYEANPVSLPYRVTFPGTPDQYEIMQMGGEGVVTYGNGRPAERPLGARIHCSGEKTER